MPRSGVGLIELLGGRLKLPTRKHKNRRVAVKSRAQHLGALYTQIDPTILNTGNGGLRNATQGGELRLAETLQLSDDPHRLTRSDIDALLGGNGLAHISVSDSHVG